MADSNRLGEPLQGAAGAAGPHAIDAFGLLGNETRLAILLALWDAYEPHAEQNAVAFSELRDQVGVRQGGQFNYHLDKLVGQFVRKTEAGYELRPTGLVLVQSIIAGTGIEDPTLEPTEVDANCTRCGATTMVTYENNRVYQVCTECDPRLDQESAHPEGALVAWTFEPTGLSDRTPEEAFAASTVKTFARIALRFEDVCPVCSGPVEWSLDACSDHATDEERCPSCGRQEAVLARETCTVCKSSGHGTPGIKLLLHPAVVSFYYDHGIEIGFTGTTDFADVVRTLDLVAGFDEEVVSTDPLRVLVTVTHDGDELGVLLDESMNVVEVAEGGLTREDERGSRRT